MYRMHGFDEYISENLGTQEAKQLYLVFFFAIVNPFEVVTLLQKKR